MSELILKIVVIAGFAVTYIALEKTFGIALALFLLIVIGLALCFILDIILLLLTSGSGKSNGLLTFCLGVMLGSSLGDDG